MDTKKHYAGDWAKAKSRDLVKGMIERTLLTFRKPEDISVLCFPGIDGAEVIQVYDALGIPRENVVGLERDPEIAGQIEANCPGIQVVNQTLEDYVAERERFNFDVVSTDYTGGVNNSQITTTSLLAKGMRKDRFIINITNIIKRDPNSFGIYAEGEMRYSGTSSGPVKKEKWPVDGLSEDQMDAISRTKSSVERLTELSDKKGSSADLKRSNYAQIVLGPIFGPKVTEHSKLLKWFLGDKYNTFLGDLQDLMDKSGERPEIDFEDPFYSIGCFPVAESMLRQIMMASFERKFAGEKIEGGKDGLNYIFKALVLGVTPQKIFIPREIKPYSYISESGAPMSGVVSFFGHSRSMSRYSRDLVRHLGYPNNFNLLDKPGFNTIFKKFMRAQLKFMEQAEYMTGDVLREPIFLGSSAKPVLTKAKALEELDNGLTTDEIRAKYRGPKLKSLAAWKAWQTMRANGTKEPTLEETIETNGDVETITKEEAIDLLREGIPPKEIGEAYPNSFTAGQLRAFKAHITMGSYSEEKVSQ